MCDENYIIDYQNIIRDIIFPKKKYLYFWSPLFTNSTLTKNANQLIVFESKMQICRFVHVVFDSDSTVYLQK